MPLLFRILSHLVFLTVTPSVLISVALSSRSVTPVLARESTRQPITDRTFGLQTLPLLSRLSYLFSAWNII